MELPGDPCAACGRDVCKLERAMYGTRDAPMIWQDHLGKTLLDVKFKESVTHRCFNMRHEAVSFVCMWTICCAQDYVKIRCGPTKQVLKEYELATIFVGEDGDMEKKALYLGRTLEWERNGLGVRPDRRHVRSLLLELGMENCREGRSSERPPGSEC